MAKKKIGIERTDDKKRVGQIMNIFNAANNPNRWNWEYYMFKGEEFYEDKQLSLEEIKDLEDADMPTFIINRMSPAIEVMKYFLTAGKPRWKSIGRDTSGFDSEVGTLHTALSDYCWDLSDGTQIYGKIIHDALVKSMGVMQIYVDKNADRGNGEVKFTSINPEEVFIDPESQDMFSRDAKYIVIARNISKSKLINELPEYADKIKQANGGMIALTNKAYWDTNIGVPTLDVVNYTGEQDEIVGYYEVYSKVLIPYVTFLQKTPPSGTELNMMQKNSIVSMKEMEKEIEVKLKEIKLKLDELVQSGEMIPERAEIEFEKSKNNLMNQYSDIQSKINNEITNEISKITERTVSQEEYDILNKDQLIKATIVKGSEINFYQTRVRCECVVGDQYLYDVVLPYENYPIIPLPFIHTGTPYPLSAVRFAIGKQEEINKCHQIIVHHANISSNPGWWYKDGSIVDLPKAESEISMPGSLIGYSGENPPTPRVPSQLNNAFYELTQLGRADISYSFGISDYMMGMERVTNEPFRSTALMDEFGTRRLRSYSQNVINPWLRHVGKVFKEIAQKTYTAHKIYKIISPESGNEKSQSKEYEINKPIFSNTGKIIGKYHDYQSANFDVVEVADSYWPTNREAKEQKMFEYWQKGGIDRQAWLRSIEIDDKTGIMNRMNEIEQLKQALAQKDNELKQVTGDNDTLRRQVIQSKILVDTVTGSLQMKKDVLETEAEQKGLREKIKAQSDIVISQLQNEVKNMRSEFELIKKQAKVNSENKSKIKETEEQNQ